MAESSSNASVDIKPSDDKKSWEQIMQEEDQKKVEEKMKNLAVPKVDAKDEDSPQPSLEKKLESKDGLRRGKIIVEQDDPNSPLYSAHSFEELNLKPELLKGVLVGMAFNKPSKIQEIALPIILGPQPKNLIAQAQSGTGKTAAFSLCMLSRADPAVDFPQSMCVCPTRELARQIMDNVKKMGQFTNLKYQLVIKDESFPKSIKSQIIVGTPGKILDLIKTRTLDCSKIKTFVLDEADVMIDKAALGDQSVKIKKSLPKNCQVLLFSATYKPEVRKFAEKIVPQPCVQIKLKRKELSLEGIQQLYIDCKTEENKFNVLSDLYAYLTVGQSIIFVHTRKTAQELTRKMIEAGHTVSLLHGGEDMSSTERDKVIDDYREGKTKVLISTNVLARGIDILQVMLVINYDLPLDGENKPDPQTYLHRIGRSGRFGRKGIAINFVADPVSKQHVKFFEQFFQRPITEFPVAKIETDLQNMLNALKEKEEAERKLAENNADDDD